MLKQKQTEADHFRPKSCSDIKLISTQVVVEIEVGVELGKNYKTYYRSTRA